MMQENMRWCYCRCSCYSCRSRDPEIPPLLMQQLPIVESRSFSDCSSRILLPLPFSPSLSISYLAIAVAIAFCKNLVSLASTRPLDRSTENDKQSSPRSPRNMRDNFKSISVILVVAANIVLRLQKHVACAIYFAICYGYTHIQWYYGRYQISVLCSTKQITHACRPMRIGQF